MKALELISVIVPIYRVEQYLTKCVDSILGQTYPNIEVILVDDGSPDSCGMICDDYACLDSRVKVIHKRNGGLSDARNAGLRHAEGDLVSFVDSDDYLSPLFLEILYAAMFAFGTKMAALPGGHDFHDGDIFSLAENLETAELVESMELINSCDYIEMMLYQKVATGAVWRLYARDVLGEDPFPVGLLYEDSATAHKFAYAAGDVAIVNNRELYAYRLRNNSIVRRQFSPIKAASAVAVTQQLYRDILERSPDIKNAAASRCFSINRMVFAQSLAGGAEFKPYLWCELTKYRRAVLSDSKARKRERLAAGISMLGEAPFSKFCSLCRRLGFLV